MKFEDYEDESISGVNITPLVDVCLVLVIIFMVTTPLLTQPLMKIILPKAHTLEGEEKENVTISISKEGDFAVNEKELNKEEILEYLKEKLVKNRYKFVIIRADQEASYENMMFAMEIAKKAGAKKLTIATEQKR
jgi:biopolymer transport protein ExbD